MKISQLKSNPNNPRLIKDDKFKKLCDSIQAFPKMMELRPIIIDEGNIILGGNMRFNALKHLGYKELPADWVKQANELTEEQKQEFIVKDNVGFGEWDWDILANEWDDLKLTEWGLDVPNYSKGMDINTSLNEDDLDLNEKFDPIGLSSNVQRVVFIFDSKDEAESYLNNLKVDFVKRNMAWQVNLSTLYTS